MINTLAIGLALALLLGMLAQRCRLSPLLGYLLAGILASSLLGGRIDSQVVEDFSHIGVVLLLFGVGLQFHVKDLMALRRVVLPLSLLCMGLWTLLGAGIYAAFSGGGFNVAGSLIFGACICISSTVVLTRVLDEHKMLQIPAGHAALGMMVVEDIFTIVLLVLMPSLLGGGDLLPALGGLTLKLSLLLFLLFFVGRYLVGKIFTYLARSSSGELFTLAVLVFALGIAVLSAYVFNASLEFGAFLSGMLVGQSRFAGRAASEALPMRDAFAVLFFVSVGMGFSPAAMWEDWPLALSALALTMLVKPLTAYWILRRMNCSGRFATILGCSLAQVGEFSFILASLSAATYHILTPSAANLITGVAIISITLNAGLFRFVPALIEAMEKRGIGLPKRPEGLAHVPEPSQDRYRVIVVGYGPCGEALTRILRLHDLDVVVIEMNIDTVQRLVGEGIPALHGDARMRTILSLAACERASAIIITAPSAPSKEIAAMARTLNPKIEVMANTAYSRTARALRKAGARSVFSGEEEVALTMCSSLLRAFGASEDMISRERDAARRLFE